jgi:hypothetical protein
VSNAMRLTPTELVDLKARMAGRLSTTAMRDHPAERQKRGQKYGNSKVEDAGRTFDSKAEHKRWQYLVMLEKAKEIRDLRCQVPFELIPAQVAPDGKKIRPTVYVADLVYIDKNGELVVEDPKGMVTPEWRIKRKLMLQVHGIWVKEIRS